MPPLESLRVLATCVRLGSFSRAAAELGIKPYPAQKLYAQVRNFSRSELDAALIRLAELDQLVRQAYADFDYKRIFAALNAFMTSDLSAFYFDIRKDTLYCDPISSRARKACLTVLDQLFRATVTWLAPILCFTAEEAWLAHDPQVTSVHLELFPELPAEWRNEALSEKWRKVRTVS